MMEPPKELTRMRKNHKRLIRLNISQERKQIIIVDHQGKPMAKFSDPQGINKLKECQILVNIQNKQIEDLKVIVFELEARIEELEN